MSNTEHHEEGEELQKHPDQICELLRPHFELSPSSFPSSSTWLQQQQNSMVTADHQTTSPMVESRIVELHQPYGGNWPQSSECPELDFLLGRNSHQSSDGECQTLTNNEQMQTQIVVFCANSYRASQRCE